MPGDLFSVKCSFFFTNYFESFFTIMFLNTDFEKFPKSKFNSFILNCTFLILTGTTGTACPSYRAPASYVAAAGTYTAPGLGE